jgi:hypothetical protein
MSRVRIGLTLVACALMAADCASDGTAPGGVYDPFLYEDPWYAGGGCCVGNPGDIGPPPRPEHPIARPPDSRPKPSQPIALPPARPMPMPRPAAAPRGGGGRR